LTCRVDDKRRRRALDEINGRNIDSIVRWKSEVAESEILRKHEFGRNILRLKDERDSLFETILMGQTEEMLESVWIAVQDMLGKGITPPAGICPEVATEAGRCKRSHRIDLVQLIQSKGCQWLRRVKLQPLASELPTTAIETPNVSNQEDTMTLSSWQPVAVQYRALLLGSDSFGLRFHSFRRLPRTHLHFS